MERTATELTCPKCGGSMRARERQGVVIDVCLDCRGVFLDRGELDRLLDLEAEAAAPYDPRDRRGDRRYSDRYNDRDDDRDDDRRPGGFLSDLFDFGD